MSDVYNMYPPGIGSMMRTSSREEVPLSPLFAGAVLESLAPTQQPNTTMSHGLDGIFTQSSSINLGSEATSNGRFEQIEAFLDQNVQDGKPLPTIYRDHETFAMYLAKYQILNDHKIDTFEFKVLAQSAAPYVQAVDYMLSKETEPVLLETPFGNFKLGANSLSRVPTEEKHETESQHEKVEPEKH